MAKKSNAEIAGDFRDYMTSKGYTFWMAGNTLRCQKVGKGPGDAILQAVFDELKTWLNEKKTEKTSKQKRHIFDAFTEILPTTPPNEPPAAPVAG